ncbi:MAG: NADH-quinone oxidoreductase subunit N [Elusimicrobia bacterium]|nr:NADH-quinone oxidoreductase subunit N [Elusimicrobiota bacterium]
MATSLVGVVALGLGRSSERRWAEVARLVAAASVAFGAGLLLREWKPWSTELVRWDAAAHAWALLFFLGTFPLLLLMRADSELPIALVLGAALGMTILACANHLFVLFLGLEVMSLATYLLVAGRRREKAALEAAIKYFFSGAIAAAVYLFGLSIYYAGTGSMQLVALNSAPVSAGLGVTLMACAALFKIGAVPMHFWLPDVYEAASPELVGFMSTAVKSAGVLLLLRLGVLSAASHPDALASALPWVAGATMTVGNLLALRQERLQRLLAYSSVSHVGYILAGVWAWLRLGTSMEGMAAVYFYLAAYLFMNTGAFLFLKLSGVTEVAQLRGLSSRAPALSAFFVLMILSLAAIPPTAGFLAKFYVLWDVLRAGGTVLAVAVALNSVIGIAYYFRLIKALLLEDGGGAAEIEESVVGRWLALACSGAVLALGLFPGAKALLMGWLNG